MDSEVLSPTKTSENVSKGRIAEIEKLLSNQTKPSWLVFKDSSIDPQWKTEVATLPQTTQFVFEEIINQCIQNGGYATFLAPGANHQIACFTEEGFKYAPNGTLPDNSVWETYLASMQRKCKLYDLNVHEYQDTPKSVPLYCASTYKAAKDFSGDDTTWQQWQMSNPQKGTKEGNLTSKTKIFPNKMTKEEEETYKQACDNEDKQKQVCADWLDQYKEARNLQSSTRKAILEKCYGHISNWCYRKMHPNYM